MAHVAPKLPRIVRFALVLPAVILAATGIACGGGSQSTAPTPPPATTPASGPKATLSPVVLTFATQTSDPQTVTLTNSGTEVLVITGLAVSGNFSETDNCVRSLDVGASCTITVAFVPLGVGGTGAVTITDNASDSPQTLTLSGPNLTTPSAILSPASLTFASQAIGTTSGPQTVTLTNPVNGNSAPLTITSTVAVGDFAIAQNTCGRLLAAGASCAISVTFTPTESGPRTGQLAVFDNAASLQQGVILNGTGR